ncbi:MAG: YeeE/YedE family protein [Planctomycetota bacterium]|jgi:uncharacterized membrane protein YedE/YeeE
MDQLFPLGVWPYLAGGVLIGAGIGLVYLLTGRIAGLSGFLTAAQAWWSRRPFFRRSEVLEERTWKGVLVAALVAGALLHTVLLGELYVTEVQWWRLGIGGVLVGVGTRTARGCTSGHGICGMSALAAPSIVSTVVFMAVAIGTARLVAMTGVTP